jgi:hypothetical protein
MNTPEYRKSYLANLKVEMTNNNKNFVANKGNPAVNQYIQNDGQVVGASTFKNKTITQLTNTQAKGTKKK